MNPQPGVRWRTFAAVTVVFGLAVLAGIAAAATDIFADLVVQCFLALASRDLSFTVSP